jgi:hypothetical protein
VLKVLDTVRVKDTAGDVLVFTTPEQVANADSRDTLTDERHHYGIYHLSEPAEMRLDASISLCYGASGYVYWTLETDNHVLREKKAFQGDTTVYWGQYDLMGPLAMTESYRDSNKVDFVIRYPWDNVGIDTIPNLYTGWGNRSHEVRQTNIWIKQVGEEMLRRQLRWRDGYSIHNSASRLDEGGHAIDGGSANPLRALPDSEIITQVKSRRPSDTAYDPDYATYVELGLFYTKSDSAHNKLHDTNYVWVQNRRVFERGGDIPDTSLRGRIMDSLAETRVIRLKFNLSHPDSTRYNFIRVREIKPDTNRLPFAAFPRQGLDTAVYADSASEVVLRAGGGCLLEITYLDPSDPLPVLVR